MKGDNSAAFSEFERELVATCGSACHRRCMQMIFTFLGGLRMTIPDIEDLYRRERNRRIRDEFCGVNHEELAIKYKITTQHVRNILKRSDEAPK